MISNRLVTSIRSLAAVFLLLLLSPVVLADEIVRLPNGLTVILDHRAGAPVTAVQLWVRAGAIDEPEEFLGMSHFLEHMLFKGTATRPVGAIHEEVEKNGGEINAATSDDWTYYHIVIAADEWRRALDIITDIAANASLPEVEVERERRVIEEEILRRDANPQARLYDLLSRARFTDHPYRHRVIGDLESLARISRERLHQYYKTMYRPDQMAIVVSGDFEPAEAATRVTEALGGIEVGPASFVRRPREGLRRDMPPQRETASIEFTYGAVAWLAPSAASLDENVIGDLLLEILTAPGTGRLSRSLVEESRLAAEIGVSFPTARDPSFFAVTYVAPPGNREAIEAEIRREIRRIRIEGVTARELDIAVARSRRDRATRDESAAARAFERGFWFAVSRPEDAAAYLGILEKIEPVEIQRFARRHLGERTEVAVAIDPAPVEEAGPTEEAFIFRHAPGPRVAVGLFLPGGQAVEPQPGWAALLAGSLNRGAEGGTHEEFERRLARLGLTLSASSTPDMISIIGTAETASLGVLLEVLFEVATRPNLGDLEIVRKNHEDALRARNDRPFDRAFDRLLALRFGTHPYGRPELGTPEGLRAASRESLAAFHREHFRRESARLVVVGGVSETEAHALPIATFLGRLEPGVAPAPPNIAIEAAGRHHEPAPGGQALVFRSVSAPATAAADYPSWKIVNAILGGRSSSRLFRIVREERGLAYATGSFYPTRHLGSQFVMYAGTRPEQADSVLVLFAEALAPASARELEDAKRLIKGEFALDHERAERRAWYLGWFEALGLDAGFDDRYPRLIDEVTLAEANRILGLLRDAPPLILIHGGDAP